MELGFHSLRQDAAARRNESGRQRLNFRFKGARMRVLVTGATGFIGAEILAALHGADFDAVAVARPGSTSARSAAHRWFEIDMVSADAAGWRAALEGAEAVVNCAGVFGDGPGQSTAGVHDRGAQTLFSAAQEAGIKCLIHFSAIGAEEERTRFAQTKLRGDRALLQSKLDWVILRPSLVMGPRASGGGALIRGLAALPVLPIDPKAGPLQVVQVDDVVKTVLRLLHSDAPRRVVLELVGPERQSLHEIVAQYRSWLGWKKARTFKAPNALMNIVYSIGDLVAALGWRSPIRSAARRELTRGASGDPASWTKRTGIEPAGLRETLSATPPSLQDRRAAQFYFLKPVVIAVTALFWIGTGVTSLTFGYDIGVTLLEEGGLGRLSGPAVIAGGAADLLIGFGVAYRPTARLALWAAILVSIFYAIASTILLPRLWLDPIGPMLKIWPLIVLNIVALFLVRDR
jgi:uncharacterized protein YbjT (DUF2867 family)